MTSHVKPLTLSPGGAGYQTPSGCGLAMGERPVSCQSAASPAACIETACGSNSS